MSFPLNTNLRFAWCSQQNWLLDAFKTPKQYNLKGSFKMATNNGKSWPHPVIVDGRLYLRDQDDLLCYDIRKASR